MLHTMDDMELFLRDSCKAFLILDGHNSSFEVDFLQYIADNDHLWSVCFGIPYRTHLWQVADSSEQNGMYKVYRREAKEKLLDYKLQKRLSGTFSSTDIIPIDNYAWKRSFDAIESNKKATSERGWHPCNRNLLLNPEVLCTKTSTENGSL
jgi:hypothetical protein